MKADQRTFEDSIVRSLLKQYGLHETRTKFMLLDLEETYFDAGSLPCVMQGFSAARMLSLRAFNHFFPGYPVRLQSRWVSTVEFNSTPLMKGLAHWNKTVFARDFSHLKYEDEFDTEEHFALVYHQPYQRDVEASLVLHNFLPIDDRVPGPHVCIRTESGELLMVERFDAFIASLNLKFAPDRWKATAIREDFDCIVRSESPAPIRH